VVLHGAHPRLPQPTEMRCVGWNKFPRCAVGRQVGVGVLVEVGRRPEEATQLGVCPQEVAPVITQQQRAMASSADETAERRKEGSGGQLGHSLQMQGLGYKTDE
jgi:hypothetical protein